MNVDHNPAESILHAIRVTQKLRSSIGQVFHNLSDGFSVAQGNEKQILNEFHQSLLTVRNDFSELEKVVSSLPPISSVSPNSIYLSIDPAIDKSPIYSQVLQAYKWSNKMSELSGYAYTMLDQHAKIKKAQAMSNVHVKRMKRSPPTGHAMMPSAVENFIGRVNKKATDLSIVITQPLGSYAILQITVGRILKAQVALRGLMIEWVNVRGYTEDNLDDSKLELWSKSKYQVFRKIAYGSELVMLYWLYYVIMIDSYGVDYTKVTESTTAAMLHFYSPYNVELSFSSFIHWFQRYKTLFSAPCQKCGKHNLGGLPPTWRDLRTAEAYHDVCRQ